MWFASRKQNTKLKFRLDIVIWIHLWGYRWVPTGSPKNNCYLPKKCASLFPAGFEPATLCVWSTRDNHYTMETFLF